jgi:hypothetical protein
VCSSIISAAQISPSTRVTGHGDAISTTPSPPPTRQRSAAQAASADASPAVSASPRPDAPRRRRLERRRSSGTPPTDGRRAPPPAPLPRHVPLSLLVVVRAVSLGALVPRLAAAGAPRGRSPAPAPPPARSPQGARPLIRAGTGLVACRPAEMRRSLGFLGGFSSCCGWGRPPVLTMPRADRFVLRFFGGLGGSWSLKCFGLYTHRLRFSL